MNLGNKLKNIRIDNGYSMEELKNLLNNKYGLSISKSMISRWENNQTEPLNTYLSAYAKEFNLDMNSLLNINIEDIPGAIPMQKGRLIPILGEIACGDPILAQENLDGYFLSDPSIIKGDFILRAQGDSMIDAGIHEGDYVFISQTPDVENGAIAAVLIDDDTTLKRFYKSDDKIVLQPENSAYSPIIITEEDGKNIKILGQVIGLYKQDIR